MSTQGPPDGNGDDDEAVDIDTDEAVDIDDDETVDMDTDADEEEFVEHEPVEDTATLIEGEPTGLYPTLPPQSGATRTHTPYDDDPFADDPGPDDRASEGLYPTHPPAPAASSGPEPTGSAANPPRARGPAGPDWTLPAGQATRPPAQPRRLEYDPRDYYAGTDWLRIAVGTLASLSLLVGIAALGFFLFGRIDSLESDEVSSDDPVAPSEVEVYKCAGDQKSVAIQAPPPAELIGGRNGTATWLAFRNQSPPPSQLWVRAEDLPTFDPESVGVVGCASSDGEFPTPVGGPTAVPVPSSEIRPPRPTPQVTVPPTPTLVPVVTPTPLPEPTPEPPPDPSPPPEEG